MQTYLLVKNFKYIMRALFLILFLSVTTIGYAQLNKNTRAKLYFAEAERHIKKNDYKTAIKYAEKAEQIMGTASPETLGLKVKAYFNEKDYVKAQQALELFINEYQNNASEGLKNETLSYFVRIDEAINKDDGNSSNTQASNAKSGKFLKYYRDNKKPVLLLKLNHSPNEKFYVYEDGEIYVSIKSNGSFVRCGKKLAPKYEDRDGLKWAWCFERPIGNKKIETYTVSTNGQVWALSRDNVYRKYGKVTEVDF